MSEAVLRTLLGISAALEGAGVPPLSPWWREQCTRFYLTPGVRLLVACVGRGGDKSRTSTIMAIAETLTGDFRIPPGERHYHTHISENRDEASKTLGVVEQYLRILQVPFTRTGDFIDLEHAPRGFKVLAARIGAVSGHRCTGWTADENATWDNEGSDPSAEVLASIRAMTVTHAAARGRMFSSPLGTIGYFHQVWSAGDSASTMTAHAPSWVANVSITEERTRELEPHAATHRREYEAIATDGASSAFEAEYVNPIVRELHPESYALHAGALFFDSSSGRGDAWTWGIAQYVVEPCGENIYLTREVRDERGVLIMRDFPEYENGQPVKNPRYHPPRRILYLSAMGAFEGNFASTVSFDDVQATMAKVAHQWGVRTCVGDGHMGFALTSGLQKLGLNYEQRPWNQNAKIEACSTARRLMRDRLLVVEPGDQADALRRELLTVQEQVTPNGISVQARRTSAGHADRASMLLLVARFEGEGAIAGSPIARRSGPQQWDPYEPNAA